MTEYEQLSAAIESRIASDPQLRALRKKIKNGTATLAESSKYSQLCAQIMGQKLSGQVLELSDCEGVCTQLLHDRYSDTNQVCEQVMRSIDERAGIAMNPRHAAFPAERVQQLAHSLTDPTVPDETIRRRANTGAANVAISFHDDFVDENAAFRSDAGYECYITRVVGGASCPWCSGMAGRYKYEEMPGDMFRRHDNCTCTVTFEQGTFRQNVWGPRSWEAPKTGAGAPPPKVFSQEEADRLEQERLSEYRGLTSGGEGGIMNSDYMMSATEQNPPNFENYTVEEDFESVQNVKRMMVEELGIPEDKIELSGIKNAKVLEPFMNRWKRIQKDTGMLFPPIRALEMINGDPNCIANFRASENVFYISSKYFNSEEALLHTLRTWANDKIMPKQCKTIAYLAEHEAAHIRYSDKYNNNPIVISLQRSFMKSKYDNDNDWKISEFVADSVAWSRVSPVNIPSQMKELVEFIKSEVKP